MRGNAILKAVKAAGTKHGATALTVLAAIGVVATAILSNKARPDADERIARAKEDKAMREAEETGENPDYDNVELTLVEKIKAALPAYVKVIIVGGLTIVCIVGSRVISVRQLGDLAAAYNIVQTVEERAIKYGDKYEKKVEEILGTEKAEEIKTEVKQEMTEETRANLESKGESWIESQIARAIHTGHGNTLIYDSFIGRFFYSDPFYVRDAWLTIRDNAYDGLYYGLGLVSLNDFYEENDLPTVPAGDRLFWDLSDGRDRIDPDFTAGQEIIDGKFTYIEMSFEDNPKGYAHPDRILR